MPADRPAVEVLREALYAATKHTGSAPGTPTGDAHLALDAVEQLVEAADAVVEEWDDPAPGGTETEFDDRVTRLGDALRAVREATVRASDRLRDWAGDPNLVGAITQDELHTIVTGYADCLDALHEVIEGSMWECPFCGLTMEAQGHTKECEYAALLSRAEGLFGETAKEQGL